MCHCRCGKKLTWKEYNYSMNAFKEELCIDCQKEERLKENPITGKIVNDKIEERYAKKKKDATNL